MKFDYNANVIDFKAGTVIIAGSGPGSEKLITLKVFYALKAADIVIYDALVNPKFIDYCKKNVKRIYAGKTGSKRDCSQEQINDWLVKYAKKNKKVLRLKGGDVSFFSRGSQEIDFLKKNEIKFQIFSGLTASQSAMKSINQEFISNGKCCNFITGHKKISKKFKEINFKNLVLNRGKIVIYMGVSQIKSISEKLISEGMNRDTESTIVSNSSLNNQSIYKTNLEKISQLVDKSPIHPPSIIIIK